MSADASLTFRIEGRDEASAAVIAVTEAMKTLESQAKALGAVLGGSLGVELGRRFDELSSRARTFSTVMSDTAERGTKAFDGETRAARELSAALREVASAQDAVTRAARGAAGGNRPPRGPSGAGNAGGRPGRNVPAVNDLRDVRARWRLREASERAERRDAEQERRATASAAAAQVRAQHDAFAQRLRDQRYLIGVRARSEAAEMRHVAGLRREHELMRRRAQVAGRHAYGHARHALRSINHPALESPGHAAALGAAFGIAAAERIIHGTVEIDAAAARYRMFAVPAGVDATAATAEARRQALVDSVKLGMDAGTLLDMQAKAVRDGIAPSIAKTLPESITAAAKVMGGDPEKLTDTLSEGIQQGLSMGLMKNAGDVRRFLNLEAGLSNYAGNSSKKMEEFVAAGGIGRGKELGLNLTDTMAYGALLNSSGMRTGQATSRFLGQLSQSVPKMFDRYRSAVQSRKNTEQDRAVRSAPGALGYGSIREMQSRILAGPEGLIEFATRLNKLSEKQRKLILEGYGFSEQGGAALAEIGASPEKSKGVLARAKELSSQAQANDYLSQKFADWQTSLANMIQQIEAGWHAIESEIGDVLKVDLITPFRNWWVELSTAIVGGDLRGRVHNALMSFVHGLGFEDVTALLKSLSSHVGTFDMAGFAQGLGEGVRAVVDSFRSMAGVFGGAGGLDARTVGKLAAEMLGLSIGLHAVAPVMTTIGGVASALLTVKAALSGAMWLSRLTGLSAGLSAVVGLDLAAGAAGLLSFAGALGVISAAVQALLSTGILPKVSLLPKDGTVEGLDAWLWGKKPDGSSARPAWVDRLTSGDALRAPVTPNASPAAPSTAPSLGDMLLDGFKAAPMAYQGADDERRNWRNLMTPAAYTTDSTDASADDRDRDTAAMIGTSRAAQRIADSLATLVPKLSMTTTASTVSGVAGSGSGGGSGGAGLSNLRYGRTSSGAYRSSPGGPGAGGGSGMTAVSKDLTPESRALLDTLASGEAPDYNVMNGGGRFSDYSRHPGGRAAGRYQFLPSTWKRVSSALGLKDFSPESQDKGAWWLAQQDYAKRTGRNLQADLGSKDPSRIAAVGRALHSTWVSLNGNFGGKYASYLGRQSMAGIAGGPGVAAAATAGASVRGLIHGNLSIGGESFRYGSGGAGGSSSIPFGDYPINPDAQGAWGRAHNAMAVNGTGSIYDKALGRMRTGIEMHAAHTAEMVTHGCMGFLAQEYPRLKARVKEMVAKYGHAYLHVGPNGATITPDKVTPASLADGAKGLPKGSTPAPHHAPAPHTPMQTAQAAPAMTIHAPIHVHGITDPHQFGRMFQEHVASAQRSRYTDPIG